ncbi:MAG: ABC transporter permease [Firmicutes bacterium]|nr:ABC transporter permease [Bacillota bacterium]
MNVNTLSVVFHKLRSHNRKNYILYVCCNFTSLLLITAYSGILFSPTVLSIFPEGGDSRKQIDMIFVMALIGCLVFTIYAAGLFYRMKSKELGVMMLLGASKQKLIKTLSGEVFILSLVSSLAGTVLGLPLAWLLWGLFRLLLVDGPEMALHFDFSCLLVSALSMCIVIFFACAIGLFYLRKVNLMDVVNTEHKNEPLRGVKKWFGWVGLLLLFSGAILGYYSSSIYMSLFQSYSPAWLNVTYAPVFIGLYLFLLHVVVNGLGVGRKNNYKGLIARSMMKFQGRQTVNNMMVVTVLITGGLFAAFYTPMLGTGHMMRTEARAFDYGFHYPYALEQTVPSQAEIDSMAQDAGTSGIADWTNIEVSTLGAAGYREVQDEGGKFHVEYLPIVGGSRFLSESAFKAFSDTECNVPKGQYYAINQVGYKNSFRLNNGADMITNMTTREEIPVTFGGYLGDDILGDRGYYVLNDEDYKKITQGISEEWKEHMVFFNTAGQDNYTFARNFFDDLVDRFAASPQAENYMISSEYDKVEEIVANENGQIYDGDTLEDSGTLSSEQRDSNGFRLYWDYMPQSKTLDSHEFLKIMAVFLVAFIFVALICLAVAMMICYTRSITIAINNRYVFDDLKRLGASPAFLRKEVKRQVSKVFAVPATVGCMAMYFLYGLVMYANDSYFSVDEIWGMIVCLAVVLAVAALIYLVYRITIRQMEEKLEIERRP